MCDKDLILIGLDVPYTVTASSSAVRSNFFDCAIGALSRAHLDSPLVPGLHCYEELSTTSRHCIRTQKRDHQVV